MRHRVLQGEDPEEVCRPSRGRKSRVEGTVEVSQKGEVVEGLSREGR